MAKSTKIIICAGGPEPFIEKINRFEDDAIYIGVDRGALNLINHGFSLDYAFGDFDSVSAIELMKIKENSAHLFQYQPEKDDTDLQLALEYVKDKLEPFGSIEIYGAMSGLGRIDHFIANFYLALEPRYEPILEKMVFIEKSHQVIIKKPGHHLIEKKAEYKYLSIISLTAVENWQIKGAKYELARSHFALPSALISNEFIESPLPIELSFSKGIVTIWYVMNDHL